MAEYKAPNAEEELVPELAEAGEIDIYDPWRELAFAVVAQAVEDYNAALRAYKRMPCDRTETTLRSLENWFMSDQCDLYLQDRLTGSVIIRRMRRKAGLPCT